MAALRASVAAQVAAAERSVWLLYMHSLYDIIHLLCWLSLMLLFDSVEQCVSGRRRGGQWVWAGKARCRRKSDAPHWPSLQGSSHHKQNSSMCHRSSCCSLSIVASICCLQDTSFSRSHTSHWVSHSHSFFTPARYFHAANLSTVPR